MLGGYLPGFHASSSDIKDEGGKRARHKRSHSVHHVKTSGEATPTRKFSVTSVDRHKPTLSSISRISALSSNLLNASISNIHRCSSAKNLFSFFSHNQRGVRDQHKELLRESESILWYNLILSKMFNYICFYSIGHRFWGGRRYGGGT